MNNRWYKDVKNNDSIAHAVFSSYYSNYDSTRYYYLRCGGKNQGYGLGEHSPSKLGYKFLGTDKTVVFSKNQRPCPKCLAAIEKERKLLKLQAAKAALQKIKLKEQVAKEKRKAKHIVNEKHTLLIQDIRKLIDSRPQSTKKMAEKIIKRVKKEYL